jgi:hypothetical protein
MHYSSTQLLNHRPIRVAFYPYTRISDPLETQDTSPTNYTSVAGEGATRLETEKANLPDCSEGQRVPRQLKHGLEQGDLVGKLAHFREQRRGRGPLPRWNVR